MTSQTAITPIEDANLFNHLGIDPNADEDKKNRISQISACIAQEGPTISEFRSQYKWLLPPNRILCRSSGFPIFDKLLVAVGRVEAVAGLIPRVGQSLHTNNAPGSMSSSSWETVNNLYTARGVLDPVTDSVRIFGSDRNILGQGLPYCWGEHSHELTGDYLRSTGVLFEGYADDNQSGNDKDRWDNGFKQHLIRKRCEQVARWLNECLYNEIAPALSLSTSSSDRSEPELSPSTENRRLDFLSRSNSSASDSSVDGTENTELTDGIIRALVYKPIPSAAMRHKLMNPWYIVVKTPAGSESEYETRDYDGYGDALPPLSPENRAVTWEQIDRDGYWIGTIGEITIRAPRKPTKEEVIRIFNLASCYRVAAAIEQHC